MDGDSIFYSFKSDLIKIEDNQHYVIYSYLENTPLNHLQIDSQELLDILGDSSASESILRWNVFAIDGFDSTISSNGFDTVNIQTTNELSVRDLLTPEKYELSQNYPNPFNPKTNIKYELPYNTHVTLYIYDIRGNYINTLIQQYQKSGSHMVLWSGLDKSGMQVSSGVYIYTLQAEKFYDSKKMIYLK